MFRKLLPLVLLAAPFTLFAQDSQSSSSSTSASMQSPMTTAPMAGPMQNPKHDQPIVSLSAGFSYLLTDLSNDQGASKDLIGWYGIPQVNLTKHIGVLADFVSSFNEHTGGSAVANGLHSNTRSFTAGPVYMLPIGKKIVPYVFAEGGAVRTSTPQSVTWNPAAVGGVGFNYNVSRHWAVQIVPGEYVAEDVSLPGGGDQWTNNFNAKAGIVLNLFGNR